MFDKLKTLWSCEVKSICDSLIKKHFEPFDLLKCDDNCNIMQMKRGRRE